MDIAAQTSLYGNYVTWDRQKMKRVFTLAGGEIDDSDMGTIKWESSTQANDTKLALYILVNDGEVGVDLESNNTHSVVPFVHF